MKKLSLLAGILAFFVQSTLALAAPIPSYPAAPTPYQAADTFIGNHNNGISNQTVQFNMAGVASYIGSASGVGQITRAQISTTTIGLNKYVILSGYRTIGDLGQGAVYSSASCSSTGWQAIQDAGATWFCLVSPTANPGFFGAYGDGTAHLLLSSDILANPQWRGQYTTAMSWDYAAIQESKYYAFAALAVPNTAAASIPWNSKTSLFNLNLPWFEPNGSFYITNTVTEVSAGASNTYASPRASCWFWQGTSGPTTPMYLTDSAAYETFPNICLENLNNSAPGQASPLWTMDHDGTYTGLSTQNLLITNGFFVAQGVNASGVSINPVGGNNAQGSTITFINGEFVGTASTPWCLRVNGTNALNIYLLNSDMQVCPHDAIQTLSGSVYLDSVSFENQALASVYPVPSQITNFGADLDVLVNGAGSSVVSSMRNIRAEDEVPFLCLVTCYGMADNVQAIGVSLSAHWVANSSTTLEGSAIQVSLPSMSFTAGISGTTMTVSAVASGVLHVGQTVVCTGCNANTTITSYLTGSGNTGTYVVGSSQTVSGGTTMYGARPNYMILLDDGGPLSNTGGSTGAQNVNGWFPIGVGSTTCVIQDPAANYTVNALAGLAFIQRFGSGLIATKGITSNTATSITLGSCLASAPTTSQTYHVEAATGSSQPSWLGATTSYYKGNAASQGFSTTAGTAQVLYTSQTPSGQMVNGNYIMLPGADQTGGTPAGAAGGVAVQGPLIAKITGSCGAGCATINKTPSQSLSFVQGYVFTTPITDNLVTWGLIPFYSFDGVQDIRTSAVPGEINGSANLINVASAMFRGNLGPNTGGSVISPNVENQIATPFLRGVGKAPAIQTQIDLTPQEATSDDIFLSASADMTLNFSTARKGIAHTFRVWVISNGTQHKVAFGNNVLGAPTFTTDGVANDEWPFVFESDAGQGTQTVWTEIAGPNLATAIGSAPALTGTCTTSTQVGGQTAGSFHATCTSQTVIITFANPAPNGWTCTAQDETTPTDTLTQTSHTASSCTLTGTTGAADNVVFKAAAF